MARKKTRKKKQSEKPKGKSKYALKVARRKRTALAAGLPADTPYPVIWASTA